jgi:ATP-dependent Lon protease
MTIVAQITVPARMSPTLAVALGEMLTARSRTAGLSEFVALALLFQTWHLEAPRSLGEVFGQMRVGVLSPTIASPLATMSAPLPYRLAAQAQLVGETQSANTAKSASTMAEHLQAFDIRALQQEADSLVYHVLSEKADDPKSLGRALFMGLVEQIGNWHPELTPTNALLLGLPHFVPATAVPKAQLTNLCAEIPSAFADEDVDEEPDGSAEGGPVGVVVNGRLVGRFQNPREAMAFATEQARRMEEREQQLAFGGMPEPSAAPAPDPNKPALQVFDRQAVIDRLQQTPMPTSPLEGNAQQRRLLEQMANDHGKRLITEVPEDNPVGELYERFPHFAEVLDFITQNLALAACGDEGRPARLPPILLRGDAGVGKTYFAQELARLMNTHFIERDLSVTSEAFVIAGIDSTFKGSKPGIVFDALVNGKTANPVILLNELDKARATGTHSSPMAALYALLEPTSAARFVDEFVPVEIDASRVIWVCTANDGDIPEPILSRLEVFDIRQPTQEECRAIAASVWKGICQRTLPRGHGFPEELGDALLTQMSRMSPRVMRKALTLAASAAVVAGRKFLLVEDLVGSQKRYAPAPAKQAIGFMPMA